MPTSSTGPGVAPATTRFHLAVVRGPDAGWVAPLGATPVLLGRGPTATLALEDPQLSREHLLVGARGGRLRARDLGSANGTVLIRARRTARGHISDTAGSAGPGRRARRLRGRWRVLREGDRIRAGASVVEVRRHPSLRQTAGSTGSTGSAGTATVGDGLLGRLLFPLIMCVTSVPLLLSGSGPWRLVLAVALPVVLLGSVLWPLVAQRRRRRQVRTGPPRADAPTEPEPDAGPDDPAGLLMAASAPPRTGRQEEWRALPTLPTLPALPTLPVWEIGDASPPSGRRPAPSTARVRRDHERARYLSGGTRALALVGRPEDVTALARWMVCRLAARLPPSRLHLDLPTGWDWATALPHRVPGTEPGRLEVHVVEGPAGGAPSGGPSIVLARDLAEVPSWCERAIEVRSGHDRQVGERWAATVCAAVVAATHRPDLLPDAVSIEATVGPGEVAGIVRGWAAATGLAAVLGVGPAGPLRLDLATEGPHALVAGTTGSGKSELLLSWLLGLAHARSPADLTLVLIDYKGGATFRPVAGVPHVAGVLSDLDAAGTTRALASLRAELRRRERLLAASGSATLAEHRARVAAEVRPPALVVMVDEFRAMADEHPDFLDALVRLAAQGRSLGIHLVLATQRPAGAVTPDMRANLTVRICLRVLEDADSIDLIGDASAARLPAVPGRAVVLAGERTLVQVPWTGPPDEGAVPRLVGRLRAAAAQVEAQEPWRTRPPRPWAEPLPDRIDVDDLSVDSVDTVDTVDTRPDGARDPGFGSRVAPALPLLLTDLPDEQRLGAWSWPVTSTLLVSGPPGSGRTTVLGTLAELARRSGIPTHVIAEDMAAVVPVASGGLHPHGTACPPEDSRRARRLVELLTAGTGAAQILLVDDVDVLCRALDETGSIGAGVDLVTELLRRARRAGVGVVLTCTGASTRWAPLVADRLVLAPQDLGDALVAGVPRELVGSGGPAGRGVLITPDASRVAQVAVAQVAPDRHLRPARAPVRLAALPTRVLLAEVPVTGHDRQGRAGGPLVLGVGGDEATAVIRDLPDGGTWLIAGPAGSGRTRALRMLADQLRAGGRTVLDGPGDLAGSVTAAGRSGADTLPARGPVLLLDDVDRLPAATLTEVAQACTTGTAVIATARPEPLLGLYHEVGARLREAPLMIVLGPAGPAAHLTGIDLRRHADADPGPGRGVLVDGGRPTPIQLAG
ncbi:FHA domain-containing protein [Occultella glacieicola]|uniref:FHA domain-containing protein n=1 Tax=Occultella glacieicola TaxID=2518684 RepID=A0ABY2EB62_9MICO|nr:FtsK/SpoIIIE domain-containing protein [Occultella glacieicola]TDE97469.1 FHA domain-containing protein [Occultella glacieicola]